MSTRDVDMEHLQTLARLELDPDEADAVAHDVAEILAYFDQLSEVDTDGVEELVRPVVPDTSWRPDDTAPSLPRQRVMQLANSERDGFVEVPRTVDDDGA